MTMPSNRSWANRAPSHTDTRQAEVLAYWRASRRLMRNDRGLRLSPAQADVVLINQALDSSWPRLKAAAVATLVLMRRSKREH